MILTSVIIGLSFGFSVAALFHSIHRSLTEEDRQMLRDIRKERDQKNEGMSLADAARMGGMDRQTLRDWAHRFNADVPRPLRPPVYGSSTHEPPEAP